MIEIIQQPPQHDVLVDARGLACPIPLLKARLEIKRMETGQVLLVMSTDAGTQRDFRTFAGSSSHEVLQEESGEGEFRFWLRIGTLEAQRSEPREYLL